MPKQEPTSNHKDIKEEIHKLGGKLTGELKHLKDKYDSLDAKNKKRLHTGLATVTAILVAAAIKGQKRKKK
jgi:hypothetical protein